MRALLSLSCLAAALAAQAPEDPAPQDFAVRAATVYTMAGAPILDGVVSAADCVLEARHDAGDHVIIVGRALRAETVSDTQPLLYHRGRYAALAGD